MEKKFTRTNMFPILLFVYKYIYLYTNARYVYVYFVYINKDKVKLIIKKKLIKHWPIIKKKYIS